MQKLCRAMLLILALFVVPLQTLCAEDRTVSEVVADGGGITATVSFSGVELSALDDTGMVTAQIAECGTNPEVGAPGVAVKGLLFEVPYGCDVHVTASSLKMRVVNDVYLAPTPRKKAAEGDTGFFIVDKEYTIDEESYARDVLFPGTLAETAFTGVLRGRRVVKVSVFPMQYNPVTQVLEVHEKIKLHVQFTEPVGVFNTVAARMPSGDAASENLFSAVYDTCIVNSNTYPQIRRESTRKVTAPQNTYATDISASPFAVRVVTSTEGMYKITYEQLTTLGVNLSTATHDNIRVYNQGVEIPVFTNGTGAFSSGDYVLLYAGAFKSLYSKTNVFWVCVGSGSGKRMNTIDGTPSSGYATPASFRNIYHAEEDKLYETIMPGIEDHWFWTHLNINATEDTENQFKSQDYVIELNNIETQSQGYGISVYLKGETSKASQNPDHHTKLYVNGSVAGDFTWDGNGELIQEIENIPASYFKDGENTITIEAVDDLNITTGDAYFMNWFDIYYDDRFVAENDALKFYANTAGGKTFALEGYTGSDIMVFNVTDGTDVSYYTGGQGSQSGSTYGLRFEDVAQENSVYYAVSDGGFLTPAEMTADDVSNLQSPRTDIDYIIITHENFYDGVQELAQYRTSKGLSVETVKIQDIYDEFSYGIKDAQAIKDFLTYAYNNWHAGDHPTYVVFVGDASSDYRDDLGNFNNGNEDFVPTYLYQTDVVGDTPNDNWFACVDGDDYLPDMIQGRLCVKTETDLQNIIDKIKRYESQGNSSWQSKVVFSADDEVMFENISDNLARYLPAYYSTKKVYVDDEQYTDITDATADLVSQMNAGALIVNYTGHGHINEWASPYLFHTPDETETRYNDRNDMDSLSNRDKLFFVMIMNCLSGYFPHWQDRYSLAEEFVRAPNKGAIACFASTSSGYPSEHQVLAREVLSGLFSDNNTIVGSLITTAKIDAFLKIYSRDIIATFTLFGDPALELKRLYQEDVGVFSLDTPQNFEVLASFPPTAFAWETGIYERFKIEYSSDPEFTVETTITVPLLPFFFFRSGEYNPNIFIWSVLNMFAAQNDTLYWRVVAYDENFNAEEYTEARSFSIE